MSILSTTRFIQKQQTDVNNYTSVGKLHMQFCLYNLLKLYNVIYRFHLYAVPKLLSMKAYCNAVRAIPITPYLFHTKYRKLYWFFAAF